MSLLTTASLWNSDDTNNSNQKRTPTLRKTIKNRKQNDNNHILSSNETFKLTTIEDMQNINDNRNSRVTDLLNKITSVDNENDNEQLGVFNPIEPPSINIKKDMDDNTLVDDYTPPKFNYADASNSFKTNNANVMYGADDSKNKNLSNYATSYDPPKNVQSKQPSYAKMGINNDSLMEKINYMIHMMEEQQHEKTGNITEEFILYTFLGVFIIFIVDSFNRTTKYTR